MSSSSAFAMLHNKIRNAAEFQGLEPDEILRRIHEETATKMANDLDKVKGGAPKGEVDPEEAFPSEIKLIARALAYRSGTLEDRQKLFDLLKRAYRVELEGEEAFRLGIDAVSEDNVEYYLSQEEYQWIVIEAPAGQTTEPEGTILGACCYSTDGQYRLKGKAVCKMGSIRYFAVLPRYHGLCIGQRLLAKVQDTMRKQGCELVLVNLASTRLSLIDWIQRRGFEPITEVSYPFEALQHTVLPGLSEPVTLVQCIYVLDPETVVKETEKFAQELETAAVSVAAEISEVSPPNPPSNSSPILADASISTSEQVPKTKKISAMSRLSIVDHVHHDVGGEDDDIVAAELAKVD